MGNKFLNSSECPAQEACWDILQLPMTNSSQKKEFICTTTKDQHVAVTKSLSELEELPANSTDVTHKSNIDRYSMHPKQLAS